MWGSLYLAIALITANLAGLIYTNNRGAAISLALISIGSFMMAAAEKIACEIRKKN